MSIRNWYKSWDLSLPPAGAGGSPRPSLPTPASGPPVLSGVAASAIFGQHGLLGPAHEGRRVPPPAHQPPHLQRAVGKNPEVARRHRPLRVLFRCHKKNPAVHPSRASLTPVIRNTLAHKSSSSAPDCAVVKERELPLVGTHPWVRSPEGGHAGPPLRESNPGFCTQRQSVRP